MNALLDEEYFIWLYKQIGNSRPKNPSRTHWSLARQLFTKEFVWIVPNDDNRVEDGRDLRHEFLEASEILDPSPEWIGLGCSFLEMLIGLSRRLSFETDGEPREWFWQLIENLDIYHNDQVYNNAIRKQIDDVLERVIWRTYNYNGQGGLFPLEMADSDQRKVEIWYQLGAYLISEM